MHFLQSDIWKGIKKNLGNGIVEYDGGWIQVTDLPFGFKIGYLPRVDLTKLNVSSILASSKKNNLIYVRVDPINNQNEINSFQYLNKNLKNISLGKPIHLQDNVLINLKLDEIEWLKNMKQKHRYNINLARKKNLRFEASKSEEGLNKFFDLYEKSVLKQGYSARSKNYIRKVWDGFKNNNSEVFIANVFHGDIAISSWFLVGYEKTLYFLYGGNDNEYRNLMGNYFLVSELFKYGKENGFETLDLFGIENPNQSENHLDGFTRFKLGFGGDVIKYADTVDLITNSFLYKVFRVGETLRSKFLFKK